MRRVLGRLTQPQTQNSTNECDKTVHAEPVIKEDVVKQLTTNFVKQNKFNISISNMSRAAIYAIYMKECNM